MSLSKEKDPISLIFQLLGFAFLITGLFIFVKIYYPVTKAEINYQVARLIPTPSPAPPVDPAFSIIIPKLNINTKVIKNVDPSNSGEYQLALTRGVAHAKNSALPGFYGNTFIFAHSASSWYQANQYNAIFYLIDKLNSGDEIDLYYQGSKYIYKVSDKKIVASTDLSYLSNNLNTKSLTLMTCWPPGTTLKRLVVIATPF